MRYFLALSALVLFSCSSMKKQTKTTSESLSGTGWAISSIAGFELEKTLSPVTLSFNAAGNRFGGNNGCNTYGGAYTLDGEKISLEKIISTKKACIPGANTERAVMNVLGSTDHYRISGDKLMLMQGDKVLAEFSRDQKVKK